jgi:subtilisin family serine protease
MNALILLLFVSVSFGFDTYWFLKIKGNHVLNVDNSSIIVKIKTINNNKLSIISDLNVFKEGVVEATITYYNIFSTKNVIHNMFSKVNTENILLFEKDAPIKMDYIKETNNVKKRYKSTNKNDINISNCRVAPSDSETSNALGYTNGFFSWGLDIITKRNLTQTGTFCPANGLKGDDIHVFVLDSGFGTPDGFNYSRIFRDYDAYVSSNNTNYTLDFWGHGTPIAGLIGSDIYGVAPNTNLHIYKVLNDTGYTTLGILLEALEYLESTNYTNGIVSISITMYKQDTTVNMTNAVYNVMRTLIDQKGFIFIVAAGNSGLDFNQLGGFPAMFGTRSGSNGVLTVGYLTSGITKAMNSNYGSNMGMLAPGTAIISCGLSGNLSELYSGSSFATPIVSGVLAIYFQNYKNNNTITILGMLISDSVKDRIYNIERYSKSPNRVVYIGDFNVENPAPPTIEPLPDYGIAIISFLSVLSGIMLIVIIIIFGKGTKVAIKNGTKFTKIDKKI